MLQEAARYFLIFVVFFLAIFQFFFFCFNFFFLSLLMVYLYYQNTKIMFCSKESSSPSSKAFWANYDYLVVVIMSHGTKGTIRTCDPLDPTNLEASSFRIDDFTLTLSKTRGLT